jgi:hypothetical protein
METNYVEIIELSEDEKKKHYQKMTKSDLIILLIACQDMLKEVIKPQIYETNVTGKL